jgi:hypothetical protein
MANNHLTSETTQLAAMKDATFGFRGGQFEITAACPKGHASLFNFGESARALTQTIGKATTACVGVTMATGDLGLGALGALSVATYDVLSGGSKTTRTPS